MKSKIIYVLSCFLIIFILVGCGKPSNPLVGTWRSYKDTLKFNEDGSFISHHYFFSGEWEYLEEGKVNIIQNINGSDTYQYEISDDGILTLTRMYRSDGEWKLSQNVYRFVKDGDDLSKLDSDNKKDDNLDEQSYVSEVSSKETDKGEENQDLIKKESTENTDVEENTQVTAQENAQVIFKEATETPSQEPTQDGTPKDNTVVNLDDYVGTYADGYNDVVIEKNNDEYIMSVDFYRITSLREGTLIASENGVIVNAIDFSGNPIKLTFNKKEDGTYSLIITDSTWDLLENGMIYDGFIKYT